MLDDKNMSLTDQDLHEKIAALMNECMREFLEKMPELSRTRREAVYHLQWALRTLPKLKDKPEDVPRYRQALAFIESLGDEDKPCHICGAKPGEVHSDICSAGACPNCTWKEGRVTESCPEHFSKPGILRDEFKSEGRAEYTPLKEGDPCPVCNGTGSCPTCGTSCLACCGTGECDSYTVGSTPVEQTDNHPWQCYYCGTWNNDPVPGDDRCHRCGKEQPK